MAPFPPFHRHLWGMLLDTEIDLVLVTVYTCDGDGNVWLAQCQETLK